MRDNASIHASAPWWVFIWVDVCLCRAYTDGRACLKVMLLVYMFSNQVREMVWHAIWIPSAFHCSLVTLALSSWHTDDKMEVLGVISSLRVIRVRVSVEGNFFLNSQWLLLYPNIYWKQALNFSFRGWFLWVYFFRWVGVVVQSPVYRSAYARGST